LSSDLTKILRRFSHILNYAGFQRRWPFVW